MIESLFGCHVFEKSFDDFDALCVVHRCRFRCAPGAATDTSAEVRSTTI